MEFPNTLLAGLQWCLERLRRLSGTSKDFAFASQLAGDLDNINSLNPPPEYALENGYAFNLRSLRSNASDELESPLKFNPLTYTETNNKEAMLQEIRAQTTMDDGQAAALCESLSRRLAFTQGPPGTGKTFLGVAIVKVLLESRPAHDARPILVVCITNHALDSFLEELRDHGVVKLARLGRGSREEWTEKYDLFTLARQTRKSQSERQTMKLAAARCDSIYAELMALAPCIISKATKPGHMITPDNVQTNRNPDKMETIIALQTTGKLRRLTRLRLLIVLRVPVILQIHENAMDLCIPRQLRASIVAEGRLHGLLCGTTWSSNTLSSTIASLK